MAMRKVTYLAVFERDENPGFSVYFPDVPGCISCGDDFDQALKMAQEALSLHIYGVEKDGEELPKKTDEIPELGKKDMVVPVSIYPDLVKEELDNRRVKTTITLPLWLKTIAEREGVNYSRLLETAIKDTLHIAV
jgi:predicted RNase H-like HicB family nuclease